MFSKPCPQKKFIKTTKYVLQTFQVRLNFTGTKPQCAWIFRFYIAKAQIIQNRGLRSTLDTGTSAHTSFSSQRMIRSDLFWYWNQLKFKLTYRKTTYRIIFLKGSGLFLKSLILASPHFSLCNFTMVLDTLDSCRLPRLQENPPGLTDHFSVHESSQPKWLFLLSSIKVHSSNVSFATVHWKETYKLWALRYEWIFENVIPSGIGCTNAMKISWTKSAAVHHQPDREITLCLVRDLITNEF